MKAGWKGGFYGQNKKDLANVLRIWRF